MAQMRMPRLEKTDYPSLSMGHSFSKTDISIVGLECQVYGLEEIRGSQKPIVGLIATHGRLGSAENMSSFASGILGHMSTLWGETERDLIVITLDQRNHGTLLKDKAANLSFDRNPRHLYDMAATIVGGCQDVSLIIDFIAAYLFPEGQRQVAEFAATGISLGGNVTWRLLQTEPRIKTAIPIIGLPFTSFEPYLRARAEGLNMSWTPPLVPPSIKTYFESVSSQGLSGFEGKRILTIHGSEDQLVPYAIGKDDITAVQRLVEDSKGAMKVQLMEGLGHVVTIDMVKMTAEWVWRYCLTARTQGR